MGAIEQLFAPRYPQLVMFDLDGTLLDSVPDLAAAVNRMLVQLGRAPASLEKVRTWVGNGAMILVRRALVGSMDCSAVSQEQAQLALELFLDAYAAEGSRSCLYPNVQQTLQQLQRKGVKMAVITNKPIKFVPALLERFALADYFDWVIGGDSLPQQKPDPAGLLWVMDKAGVSPGSSLFVGDSKNDIQAARAAGVACVAMSYGYNHGQPVAGHDPDLVIDDLQQLLA